jgi:hypothetical protein
VVDAVRVRGVNGRSADGRGRFDVAVVPAISILLHHVMGSM